jgi:hypothetical protein
MQTDLKPWLHDLLLDRRTLNRGYFKSATIMHLLQAHSRSGQYSKELFSLAVLELWHRVFLDAGSAAGFDTGSKAIETSLITPQVIMT